MYLQELNAAYNNSGIGHVLCNSKESLEHAEQQLVHCCWKYTLYVRPPGSTFDINCYSIGQSSPFHQWYAAIFKLSECLPEFQQNELDVAYIGRRWIFRLLIYIIKRRFYRNEIPIYSVIQSSSTLAQESLCIPVALKMQIYSIFYPPTYYTM